MENCEITRIFRIVDLEDDILKFALKTFIGLNELKRNAG